MRFGGATEQRRFGAPYRSKILMGDFRMLEIEVTDGWYSVKARLDLPLLQRLARGQIFAGQN